MVFHGVINNLNGEENIGTFYEKELQKTNQQGLRTKKVIKKRKKFICQMKTI